jgi:hypothetical protein
MIQLLPLCFFWISALFQALKARNISLIYLWIFSFLLLEAYLFIFCLFLQYYFINFFIYNLNRFYLDIFIKFNFFVFYYVSIIINNCLLIKYFDFASFSYSFYENSNILSFWKREYLNLRIHHIHFARIASYLLFYF